MLFTSFMGDLYHLRDMQIVRQHAFEQGLTRRGYMGLGMEHGFSKESLLDMARDGVTLEDALDARETGRREELNRRIRTEGRRTVYGWVRNGVAVGILIGMGFVFHGNYSVEESWRADLDILYEDVTDVCIDLDNSFTCREKATL